MKLAIVAALGVLGVATKAASTEFIETFTGVVGKVVAQSDEGIQSGDPFLLDFAYNTDVGDTKYPYELGFAGTPASHLLAAYIVVDAKRYTLKYGYLSGAFYVPSHQAAEASADLPGSNANVMLLNLSRPSYFDTPFSASGSGGDGDFLIGHGYFYSLNLRLVPESVSLSYTNEVFPSPIPEPMTWALMLTGFGLVGAMRRSRRISPPPSSPRSTRRLDSRAISPMR